MRNLSLDFITSNRLGYRKNGSRDTLEVPKLNKMVKRNKPNISIESIDFGTPISAKSKQAWKYAGGSVVRAPAGLLPGLFDHDRGDGEKRLPRRKQESNFFITINSNQAPKDALDVDESMRAMDKMLHSIAEERVMATYLKFGPKHEDYRDDKYSDVIIGVDWKAATEIGPTQGKVHSHISVTITHYSQIQINTQMLMYHSKRLYNANTLNFKMKRQPYVHVKLLPQSNWTDVMRQYIHKGMMGV